MGSPTPLEAGDAKVEIAANVGGAIASFTWRGADVLRPTPEAARASGNVRLFACYPLVPFSNRIAGATLVLRDGTSHALARNFGDHPHAIHGVGWQRPWQLAASSAHHALLTLEHVPAGEGARAWPFAFRAAQSLTLTVDGDTAALTMSLAIENADTRPFPFGLGWHPFFPRDDATLLGFAAERMWQTDATCLPTEPRAIEGEIRFDPPRAIGATTLDNVFAGWRGRAELAWPERARRVVVEADASCSHLVVFVPPERDFVAVEPVTHMTDAFNRDARGERGTGTRELGPAQSYCCTMRIVCTTLA